MKRKAHTAGHDAWQKAKYDAAGTDDRLIMNLRDLSHILHFLYEGKGSQKRTLIVLAEAGGRITQRELTERLGIRPGSASEVIAKLESAGFVARTPSAADRRTAEVVLTPEGAAEAAAAKRQRQSRHQEMFACLTEAEKSELLALLEKLNGHWQSRYGSAEGEKKHHGGAGMFHRGRAR